MSVEPPLEAWPDALERACSRTTLLGHVFVLRETDSTQDAAERMGVPCGSVVVAGRQTRGRGRLGAAWQDTQTDGLAVTCVVPTMAPERLSMASALAAARSVREGLPRDEAERVGVKWPNDVVAIGPGPIVRKMAGVLVETRQDRASVGIGINVGQRGFAGDLTRRAASMAMLGGAADRLRVLQDLIRNLDQALAMDHAELVAAWRDLDRTAGMDLGFLTPDGPVRGTVLDCDPLRGLRVRTASGEIFLPSATTRVQVEPPEGRSTMSAP
jgi:BirA family biotin operon repressor/biotin-[acetyl-CoA-carboxylase] ligase